MKTLFIFLPIRDYIKTRRKLWRQYLIPLAAGIFVLIGAFVIDDCSDVSYQMAHFNQCIFLNAYFVGHDGMCYANVFDLLEG